MTDVVWSASPPDGHYHDQDHVAMRLRFPKVGEWPPLVVENVDVRHLAGRPVRRRFA